MKKQDPGCRTPNATRSAPLGCIPVPEKQKQEVDAENANILHDFPIARGFLEGSDEFLSTVKCVGVRVPNSYLVSTEKGAELEA